MYRNIFWRSLEVGRFQDGRTRLFVEFAGSKDTDATLGEWTPRWSEVMSLVSALVEVERQNCDSSEYTEKLHALFAAIAIRLRSAASARAFFGRLVEYNVADGKAFAVIEEGETVAGRFIPVDSATFALGVPLSDGDVSSMLVSGSVHRWFVWNGIVVGRIPIERKGKSAATELRNAVAATHSLSPN